MASSGGMWHNAKSGSRVASKPYSRTSINKPGTRKDFTSIVGGGVLRTLRERGNKKLMAADRAHDKNVAAAKAVISKVRKGR